MKADQEKEAGDTGEGKEGPGGRKMRDIVHSLNNVLAVIQLNASMALESLAGQGAREEIQEIIDAVARGRGLVRDLSDARQSVLEERKVGEHADPYSPSPPERSGFMTSCRPGGGVRILFVDDEVELARLGQRFLIKSGYQVEFFTDSQAAFEQFSATPGEYALVITDQNMPGLKGTELANRILQIRPDTPILLCTGYSPDFARRNYREQGFCGLLVKPYQPADLLSAVRGVLSGEDKMAAGSPSPPLFSVTGR